MLAPHDPLPAEVIEALRRGNAFEAMAQLRARGVGFAEAARRIRDHLGKQARSGAAAHAARALPPDAAQALARGDKIGAIKLVRAETGIGLKEAKDWVEAKSPAPRLPTGLAPGEVPRGGDAILAWVVAILAIAAVAYGLFATR
jgi:ribosomal protein L7/L12